MRKAAITAFLAVSSVLFCRAQGIRSAMEQQASQQQQQLRQLVPTQCPNGNWGYKDDKTGEIVVPCKYDYAGDFVNGLAGVGILDPSVQVCTENGFKSGYIDKIGKKLQAEPCEFTKKRTKPIAYGR